MLRLRLLATLLTLHIGTTLNGNADVMNKYACELWNLSISCDNNSTINILEAMYGRLNNNTCNDGLSMNNRNWRTNCSSLSPEKILSEKCNNRTNCVLNPENKGRVYNELFGDPCVGTGKYLNVSYTCVSGAATLSTGLNHMSDATTLAGVECHCNAETRSKVSWPVTKCNSSAAQECPNNKKQMKACRWCSNWKWRHPNLIECVTEEIVNEKNELESLRRNFSVAFTKEMLSRVRSMSQRNDLHAGDLYELPRLMMELVELSANDNKIVNYSDAESLNELVLNSTGNLLSNVYDDNWMDLQPSNQSRTATRLLAALEDSAAILAKAIYKPMKLDKAAVGIALRIHVINITQSVSEELSVTFVNSDVSFSIRVQGAKMKACADGGKFDLERIVIVVYDDIEKWLSVFPSNSLNDAHAAAAAAAAAETPTSESDDSDVPVQPFIITKVFSASIVSCDEYSTVLRHPIRFTLGHKSKPPNSTVPTCVFWKFSKDDFVGHWSDEGCKVVSSNHYNTTCECSHLTSFSVLMSVAEQTPTDIPEFFGTVTTIGCSISIAALILTIIIYAVTWKDAKSHQAVVLLNLCVALVVADVIFLAAIDKVDSEIGCKVVAVLLHYFFLAAFFIMLVEGIQLLVYTFLVFHVRRTREIALLLVAAWVLPLIIVGISLGISRAEGYGNDNTCWLSVQKNLIWAFAGPVLCIVGVNIVISVMVLSRISAAQFSSSKNNKPKIRGMLWNVTVICPILGIPWLFGVVSSSSVIVAFVFTVVNSLQGLFILIFHTLAYNKRISARLSAFIAQHMRWVLFPKRQTGSKSGVKNIAAATTKAAPITEGLYNKANISAVTGSTVTSSEISCGESADV